MVLNIYDGNKSVEDHMFIMCFVSVCLQDWVCRRENADQLVYVSPLQVS